MPARPPADPARPRNTKRPALAVALAATLVAGEQSAGDHVVRWEGRSDGGRPVASGAYFALLRAGSVELKEKLILLK